MNQPSADTNPARSTGDHQGMLTPTNAAHAVLAGALAIAFFAAPIMPLLDWPQHLLNVSILAHANDPQWGFNAFYVVEPRITTYLGAWLPAALLALPFGPETALRIVTFAAVATTPPAFGFLLRRTGRSPAQALLLWPWVLSFAFWMGFIPFVCSIPLAFVCLGLAVESGHAQGRRPAIQLAFALVLLFLTHSFMFAITAAIAAMVGLAASAGRLRNTITGALAFVPAGLLWLVWFFSHYALDAADALGASVSAIYGLDSSGSGQLGSSSESIGQRIAVMWTQFTEPIRDARDDGPLTVAAVVGTASLLVSWLIALLVRRPSEPPASSPADANDSPRPQQRPGFAPGTLLGLLLPLPALLIPFDLAGVHAVGPRFLIFLIAGVIVTLAPPAAWSPDARQSRWLGAADTLPRATVAVIALWLFAGFWTVTRDVASENEGFNEVVEALPSGQRVYGLIDSPWSAFVARPPFLHAAATAVALRGGAVGFSFFNNLSVPIRIRVPGALPWAGRRAEWEPQRFVEDAYGPWYDYLLVRGGPSRLDRRLRSDPGVWEQVSNAGSWRLFQRTQPDRRPVVMSLLEHIHRASVTITNERTPCPLAERYQHQCPQQPWLWVGPTEQHIQGLQHPCIWAHPMAGEEVRIAWTDLPASAVAIRGWAALADSAFSGGRPSMEPVTLEFLVDGQTAGNVDAPARRGLFPYEIQIPEPTSLSTERTLQVVIRARDDGRRHFCFTGSVLAASAD